MTAQSSFVQDVLPDAQVASSRTGVPISVIIAQWANETGWGTSQAWTQGHNYAGVSPGGSVASYPDRATGLAAYISTMLQPAYAAVRSAGSSLAAATALGQSPWAGSRYDNAYYGQSPGGPGTILTGEISTYGLSAYDTPGATGLGASTTAFQIPGVLGALPGANDLANSVISGLTNSIREPAIKAVFLAGAVGLIILAGYQITKPARQQLEQKAGQAASVAAVVA